MCHCPNGAIDKHPNGFVVCVSCANPAMSNCDREFEIDDNDANGSNFD